MSLPKQEQDMDRQPFLDKAHQDWDSTDSRSSTVDGDDFSPRTPSRRCSFRWAVLFHIALILTYTAIFFYITKLHFAGTEIRPQLTYSPASGAIEYVTKAVDGLATDSIYAGDPNPALDDAWHKLLANINLRIYPEEMARLNQTSLALADGSGYLGTLGVYHELHCIKRTRKWFYKEYYYPNMTDHDRLEHYTHVEHCLELLRQAAICKGDTSVTAFKWLRTGHHTLEPSTQEGVLHQCVDWDRLAAWAAERRVDLFDPRTLVPPPRDGDRNGNGVVGGG